jgi:hypothetical protein
MSAKRPSNAPWRSVFDGCFLMARTLHRARGVGKEKNLI